MEDGEFKYVPENLKSDFKLADGLTEGIKTKSGYFPRRWQ